jgi:hypothetical protein
VIDVGGNISSTVNATGSDEQPEDRSVTVNE